MLRLPAKKPSPQVTSTYAGLCMDMIRARFIENGGPIHLPDDLDSHAFIAFAGSHGISAALADGIRAAGLDGPYAPGMRLLLEAIEKLNAANNASIRQTLLRIGQMLANAGIDCVALKGGAFLAEARADLGWRTLSDLDLLVRQDQLHQTVRLMQSGEFKLAWSEERYRQEDHQHFPALVSEQTGVAVELHTRAIWDPGRDPLDPERVFSDAVIAAEVPGIRIPSPDHRVMHLVAHCQISDKFHPARKIMLKDVLDLAVLCREHDIDWHEIEAAYRRIGRLPELTGFLSASQTLLGKALPSLPLALDPGQAWASRALSNYYSGSSDRNRMALDITRDYTHRVLTRPGGITLLLTTLFSPVRLRSLLDTHYRKWRK